MRIIAKKKIISYYTEHSTAKTALQEWYAKTKRAEWENFAQVKKSFNSADYVGNDRIVFNIKGNVFRLVAIVLYKTKMVYIRFIGTHAEYDSIKNIESI